MIGLDTNVLVRYFVRDDARQAAVAKRLIDEARAGGEKLFIDLVVLAELAWILSGPYRLGREDLAIAIERILYTTQFEVEGKDVVWQALQDFRASSADFAGCLIGAMNHTAGCSATVTFDRKAGKLETFRLL